MSNTRHCLECLKKIPWTDKVCKYCGANQYGKNNEYYPDEKSMAMAQELLNNMHVNEQPEKKRKSKRGFSDEEILALGLYPKDEKYKMSLISKILDQK